MNDFKEWLMSDDGKKCMAWPVDGPTYLANRLWWAFRAGAEYTSQTQSSQFENKECGVDPLEAGEPTP